MKKGWIIALASVLVVALGCCLYFFLQSRQTHQQMQEMEEMMAYEKEQLEEEYQDLAMQFDGYGADIHNDSLAELLSKEQQRVQDLLEELRITKVTNARRIAELKKELATVRSVMVSYVHQIDSLQSTNKQLVSENKQVRQQYQQVSQKATQLEEQHKQLSEVVHRAAMMEVSHFQMTPLNKNGRKTSFYTKIQKLQFTYSILKNITAEPGVKTLYLRLVRPDGEVMQKNSANTFAYENQQLAWSLKKDFEWGGEEMSDLLYWQVDEILPVGTYNADFFIDGNLVGSFPFRIEK